MDIMNAFPSNYLKAGDLQGREVQVYMDHVKMEDIGGDQKPVLYFRDKEKGIVLNKTNATNISMAYGQNTDNWSGQPVILYTAWVDFQGKSTQAIRVRSPQAGQAQQTAMTAQAPAGTDPFAGVQMPNDPAYPSDNKNELNDDIPF